jgi:hypothetical protein
MMSADCVDGAVHIVLEAYVFPAQTSLICMDEKCQGCDFIEFH